jgi:cytochrome c peroxidase
MLNPVEMAMPSADQAVAVLKSIPAYVSAFNRAFPGDSDPVTFDNLARAIGAFERRLSTPGRWDKFLTGDRGAVTREEMRGWMTFHHAGCTACHNGSTFGGQSFQKLGLRVEWPQPADQGRYDVTKMAQDRMVFKVPSLRNVEKTAPYFHDGSIETLPEAVRLMGRHQLGIKLEDSEVQSIISWLHTLTGDIPRDYVRAPELPNSSPNHHSR